MHRRSFPGCVESGAGTLLQIISFRGRVASRRWFLDLTFTEYQFAPEAIETDDELSSPLQQDDAREAPSNTRHAFTH